MISYFFANGWSVGIGGGAVFGGSLSGDDEDLQVRPGGLVSARLGKSFIQEKGAVPFLNGSLTLSFSKTWVGNERTADMMLASDGRLGISVGYTIKDVWQIYLAPRVFGGPVFHFKDDKKVQGHDKYFFQAGIGTSLLLPGGITLFLYGSPLGERALSGGLALAF